MPSWIYFLLFFIICIFYFHIQQRWKTSEDLEIYEYEYSTYEGLQETCKCKQPFLFYFTNNPPPKPSQLEYIHIRDTREQNAKTNNDTLLLSFHSGYALMETDKASHFYSYRNYQEIQNNTDLYKWFSSIDSLLKPSLHYSSKYDLLYGSKKACTTTTMYYESHNFLYLPSDTNNSFVRVRMTPYKSRTFFDVNSDYVNYEFWTDFNLFDDNHTEVKSIDFLLQREQVLFIPAYWFYSIEFQEKESEVCLFRYTTYPNLFANAKHTCLYLMQQQNIEEQWLKPLYDSSKTTDIERIEESIQCSNSNEEKDSNHENGLQKKMQKEECKEDVVNNLIEQISVAK